MKSVIVTNLGGHEVLGRCSPKKARKLIWKGAARATSYYVEGTYGGLGEPRVIELSKYIYPGWLYGEHKRKKSFSKKAVLKRDSYLCAYGEVNPNTGKVISCGRKGITIDHVIPRAQGGKSEWSNCVACCEEHNSRKSHKTIEEAGLVLLSPPFIP